MLSPAQHETDSRPGVRIWKHRGPIKARLPKDRDAVVALIDRALAGGVVLTPEFMRGL